MNLRCDSYTHDIGDEAVNHVGSDALTDDDTEDVDVLKVGRELVVGDNPALGAEERLDPLLLDVWVLGAVRLREAEGHDGQARDVALDVTSVEAADGALDGRRKAGILGDRAVDVTEDLEEAALLERAREQAGVLHVVERDGAVALEAEVQEVEVLRDDRVRWTREVERERVLDRAEVVQLEDEVLREVLLGAPDDPANTDVGKTELVTGGVDRDNTGDTEVPLELGGGEGSDEASRSTVDVDGDGVTGAGLVLIEESRHLLHGLVVAGVGACGAYKPHKTLDEGSKELTAKDNVDTNGVLVNVFHSLLSVKAVAALVGDGDETALDLEVASELLKRNLGVGTHNDVRARLVDRLARLLALLLPDALHGKTAKLDSLRRAGSRGTNSAVGVGRVPEVSEDGDAAGVDFLYSVCVRMHPTARGGMHVRVMGYSSWSIKFLEMFSIISLLASSGIQVCTKDARFRAGDPSRVSSSWSTLR